MSTADRSTVDDDMAKWKKQLESRRTVDCNAATIQLACARKCYVYVGGLSRVMSLDSAFSRQPQGQRWTCGISANLAKKCCYSPSALTQFFANMQSYSLNYTLSWKSLWSYRTEEWEWQ